MFAGTAHRDAISNGGSGRQRHWLAFCYRHLHGRQPGGLYSKDLNFRIALFYCARYPADQAAASDRYDDCIRAWLLLQNLEPQRTLAGNHMVIIEGMNQREPVSFGSPERFLVGLVIIRAVKNNISAVGACRRDFGQRRGKRHANLRVHAQPPGMIGQPLGVISRRGRNHARAFLLGGEREQLIERTALFKCACSLQIVELEKN